MAEILCQLQGSGQCCIAVLVAVPLKGKDQGRRHVNLSYTPAQFALHYGFWELKAAVPLIRHP